MSNFAAKIVNNPKMEEVIAIIVTILGSAIYAYLETSYKKHKERKATATHPSTTDTRHIPAPPRDTTVAPNPAQPTTILPEEGQRITESDVTTGHRPPTQAPRHTPRQRQLQLQRWRRALIDSEILTPKYH